MTRKLSTLFVALVILAALATATLAEGQCSVATRTTMFGPTHLVVSKTILSTGLNCPTKFSTGITSSNEYCGKNFRGAGWQNCPTGGGGCYQIVLRVATPLLPKTVSCGMICDCGTVTIDNSDGLPVELLTLEIE